MSAQKIRSDYSRLSEIATTFSRESEQTQQALSNLRTKTETLAGGDWVGSAATKFYTEMNERVLPAFGRLSSALGQAADTTRHISALMKQAESESAQVFRLDGPDGSPTAGAVSALADKLGGDPSTTASMKSKPGGNGDKKGGSPGGTGAGSGSASPSAGKAGGKAAGSAGSTTPFKAELFSKLPPDVEKIASKSDILMGQLKKLQADGWTVMVSPLPQPGPDLDQIKTDNKGNPILPDTTNAADTFSSHKVLRIYDDPNASPETFVDRIAHEVGHGIDNPKFSRPDAKGMTESKYIQTNLARALKSEGEAVFNELKVRDEIKNNGGPDIGMSDAHLSDNPNIINDYLGDFNDKKLNHAQIVDKIAQRYDTANSETPGYTQHFKDNWDFFKKTGKVNDWD